MSQLRELQSNSQQQELDEILRRETERKHLQYLERRASYISPGRRDVERQQALLAARGFSAVTNPDGTEILGLLWPSEEQMREDYRGFVRVAEILWATQQQSDEQFHALPVHRSVENEKLSPFQRVEAALLGEQHVARSGMPLFRLLNDPAIAVSPSHRGVTPAAHSLTVLDILNTQHLDSQMSRFLARLQAALHDLGKLCIADKDIFQDHAVISFYIFRQFLQQFLTERFEFSELEAAMLAQKASLPVKYHHLFEQVEEGFLTEEEAAGLLGSADLVELTATLALADRLSVKKERHTIFAFMVFFSYEQLLGQLVVSEKVSQMAEKLKRHCLSDVALVAEEYADIPHLMDELALPVIREVFRFDVTLHDLLQMLGIGLLQPVEGET